MRFCQYISSCVNFINVTKANKPFSHRTNRTPTIDTKLKWYKLSRSWRWWKSRTLCKLSAKAKERDVIDSNLLTVTMHVVNRVQISTYHSNFPKVDHSGNVARIVLEQNKFSKKVSSNRDWTLNPILIMANCDTNGSITLYVSHMIRVSGIKMVQIRNRTVLDITSK